MTCSTNRARRGIDGFTLVEMLVVLGIIVVLATLLVPTIMRARYQATRAAVAAEIQAISTALETYKQDHGDYPRVMKNPAWTNPDFYSPNPAPNPPSGAQILCQALMGPADRVANPAPAANQRPVQDGNDGFGFRVRQGGQVYGPYLRVGQFRVGDPENPGATPPAPFRMCLLDANDQPILYYPARPGPRVLEPTSGNSNPPKYIGNSISGTTGENCTWDVGDNRFDSNRSPVYVSQGDFQAMVGDYDGSDWIETTGAGGRVPEQELATGPYILWSAGADGEFGPTFDGSMRHPDRLAPDKSMLNSQAVKNCDDVTNFRS